MLFVVKEKQQNEIRSLFNSTFIIKIAYTSSIYIHYDPELGRKMRERLMSSLEEICIFLG